MTFRGLTSSRPESTLSQCGGAFFVINNWLESPDLDPCAHGILLEANPVCVKETRAILPGRGSWLQGG